MKGLGFFTGRIYSDEERRNARECCHVITNQQANDEGFIAMQHMSDLMTCLRCIGCPEAKGEIK